MKKRQRVLTSERFHADLLRRGVVQPGEMIREIIIVARQGEVVKLWVQRIGDERLVGVLPAGLEEGQL